MILFHEILSNNLFEFLRPHLLEFLRPNLFVFLRIITESLLLANIIENYKNFWTVFWTWLLIYDVQEEQNIVHGIERCFSDSIGLIWHYALDKCCDSTIFIKQSWPYDFCKLVEYSLVTSLGLWIVEARCVNHSQITCCSCFHNACDRFVGLLEIETAWKILLREMLIVKFRNLWKSGGFSLSTFSESNQSQEFLLYSLIFVINFFPDNLFIKFC